MREPSESSGQTLKSRDIGQEEIRAYESVTLANLAAVRKTLDERGLLAADEFDSGAAEGAGVSGCQKLVR